MTNNTSLIVVLNDGETFTNIEGTMIAAVPHDIHDDDIEEFLKESRYDHMHLGEIRDTDTILRFFRIFFPDMLVHKDDSNQIVINTGVYE